MALISGKTGWFKSGATNYAFRSWRLRISAARIDVTNFTSNGWSQFLPGFNSGEVSAQGFLDTSNQFTAGSTMALNMSLGDNYYVTMNAVLLDMNISAAVDQAGTVELSFGTNGQFNTTFSL